MKWGLAPYNFEGWFFKGLEKWWCIYGGVFIVF